MDFLKEYYVCMLLLAVLSFLVPKEEYKAYMQFFISVFVVVLLLKPVLHLFLADRPDVIYDFFETYNVQLERYEIDLTEEGNVFEYFISEGEGE